MRHDGYIESSPVEDGKYWVRVNETLNGVVVKRAYRIDDYENGKWKRYEGKVSGYRPNRARSRHLPARY